MYLGLSAAEFNDIHEAVREGMAYVAIPVMFFRANPQEVDPLYQEAEGGEDNFEPFPASIRASTAIKPAEEVLTRYGLQGDVDVLLFIPRGYVVDWEEENGVPFVVTEDMVFEVDGGRYNVERVRTDPLPVGDGSTSDYIGMVVTGSVKPRS